MRHSLFVIVLSFQVGYSLTYSRPELIANPPPQKHGSHNLLKLESSNNSVHRPVRCSPCGTDPIRKKPISNHLNPEYRGNGADNLGYDWSPMAWGGLAFPHRSKMFMGGMRGRDGRQMQMGNWGQNQGNVHVICDTCRAYWEGGEGGISGGSRGGGGGGGVGGIGGRESDRGRHYYGSGGQNSYGGQSGYWQGNRPMTPQDYETRVSSPTVGVLVKPGSRIAYIPSRSGEMYWDGISGGGTRWDGFSNGISWIGGGGGAPEWDRSDSPSREDKPGYSPESSRPGSNQPYNPNALGSWNNQKGMPEWNDNSGKGYYFANGPSNQIDPQWKDRGYASNWHYGSTNQNGWNGNSMKWSYGGKKWEDNDRAANRFYFNSPQDRTYGPSGGGSQAQYGNQYPNYQPSSGYPINFRPKPAWRPDGGYRLNDRDPSNFQPAQYGGDKNRPWDYNSRDPYGYKTPGPAPEWMRPGPGYVPQGDFNKGSSGKYPGPSQGYSPNDKFPASDKNDYDKPWNGPSGYTPSKPEGGGNFPYGGHRYPGGFGGKPSYSGVSNHLFYPNDGNQQPSYPNTGSGFSGSIRPTYPIDGGRPGGHPSAGNQVGGYPGNDRPSNEHPTGGRPSVIYTGVRPSGGSSPDGYPENGGSSGGYPIGGSRPSGYPRPSVGYPSSESSGGYPSGGNRPSGYPSGGNRPSGYPSDGSSYPSGGRPDGYPSIGSYPGGGVRPDGFSGGGSRPSINQGGGSSFGGYQSGGGSYPSGTNRPAVYPSGGGGSPYFTGGSGSYPEGSKYPGGYYNPGRPSGYPGGGGGGRPDGYPSDNYRPSYPSGQSGYPGGSGGVYFQGGKNPPKGYYTGIITELRPGDGYPSYGGGYPNYFGGSYPGDKNTYPGKDRDRYPYGGDSNRYPSSDKDRYPYGEDRYSGGGGGSYPIADKDKYPGYDRGGDRFYYGQNDGKGNPNGYSSGNRYPGSGGSSGEYDNNLGSNSDKNTWNYGQDERKDGIYRRSGGSYPPYRGGTYYTSSYLASMSTTSGSPSESKTQNVTKADEVTQPTPDS